MQKLDKETERKLTRYLLADRQWKREHRIGFARLMLKFAHHSDVRDVPFWRAVIKANEL